MARTTLQTLLDGQGKSQSELARLIGKTPSFVNRLVSGKESPSKETIDAVLKALGAKYEEAFPRKKGRGGVICKLCLIRVAVKGQPDCKYCRKKAAARKTRRAA